MIDFKVKAIYSDGLQMGVFFLVVDFQLGGSISNKATPSVKCKCYVANPLALSTNTVVIKQVSMSG